MAAWLLTSTRRTSACLTVLLLSTLLNAEGPTEPTSPTISSYQTSSSLALPQQSNTSSATSASVTHMNTQSIPTNVNNSTSTKTLASSAIDSSSKLSVSLGSNQTSTVMRSSISSSASLSRNMVTSTTFVPLLITVTPSISVTVSLSNSTTTVSMVTASPSASESSNFTTGSASSNSRTSFSSLSVSMSDSVLPSPSVKINSSMSTHASTEVVGTGNVSSALKSSPSINVVISNSSSSISSSLTSYVGDMNSTTSAIITPSSAINSSMTMTSSSGVLLPITPSPSLGSSSLPGMAVSSTISNTTMASSVVASESLNVSSLPSSTSPGPFFSSTVVNTSSPGVAVSSMVTNMTMVSSVASSSASSVSFVSSPVVNMSLPSTTVSSPVINKTVASSVAASQSINASSSSFFMSTSYSSPGVTVTSAVINTTMTSSVDVSEFRNRSSSVSLVSTFSTTYPGIISSSATLTTISASVPINVSSATSTLQMSSSVAVLPTTPPLIAPSEPPQNVTAYNTSSTSIFVTWQSPPADTLNGVLQKYEIAVQKLVSQSCQVSSSANSSGNASALPTSATFSSTSSMNIIPSSSVTISPAIPIEPTIPPEPLGSLISAGLNLSITVNNLEKFTCYEVCVRAVTLLPGPWSSPVAVKTDEDVPSHPLNVSVVDQNATSAMITWTSPAAPNGIIVGYRIRYGFSNSSITTRDGTGDQFSVVLYGLRPYTTYTAKVAAFTRIGSGEFLSVQFKTLQAAPSSVRNLTGMAINSTAVKLSWKIPQYPNGAIVYVVSIQNSGSQGTVVANTEFIVSGLQAATLYTFSVFAKNIKFSFMSDAEKVIVETRSSEPTDPPLDVRATTVTSSSILVEWLPPPFSSRHGSITNYIVEYYTAIDKDTILTNSTADNTTSLTLTSLKPFTEYYIRVKAVNFAGAGPASEAVTNTTFEDAPSPPTNFTVRSVNATSLLASWSRPDSFNGALVHYKLYSRQTTLNATKDSLVYDGEDTMFLITGLHEFVKYTITLFAYNVNHGYTSTAVVAMETTHPSAPSGPPQGVQATTLSSHSIRVDWDPPKALDRNGMITGYIVRCQTLQESLSNHSVVGDSRSVVFSSLEPFTKYYFTVQAVNKVGVGPVSAPVENITFEDVPGPVIISHVTNVSSTVLQVSWLPPKHPNGHLTEFRICWHHVDVLNQTCQSVNGALRSFNVTGLEPLSSFNISITARTSVGYGPVISAMYRTTEGVPSKPLDLQAWNVSATSVFVTWKAPRDINGILTYYKVFYRPNGSSSVPSFILQPGLSTNATLHSMHPFTLYMIYVRAATSQGFGPAAMVIVTTDEGRPSGIPYLTAIVKMSRSVSLRWDSPACPNGHIGYKLVYGPHDLSWNRTLSYPDTSTDATVKNLLPYTEYTFIISAYNLRYGWSGAASNTTAKTRPERPSGPPLNIHLVDKTFESLTIAWDPPASPNGIIISYFITVNEGENNRYRDTHTVTGDSSSYKVKALLPWHEYTVVITCTSNGGRGPDSERKTFRTLPSVPPTVPPIQPPNKEVITAHEIVIVLEKASDSNGEISFYQVVVLELSKNEDGAPIIPQKDPDDYKPEDLVTYFDANRQKPKLVPYVAAQFPADEFSKYHEFKVGNAKNFSVGARRRRDTTGEYYNGPLEPSTFYVMFQRAAINKDIYRSTQWTEPVSTSESAAPKGRTHEPSRTNVGLIAGLCIAFLFIIVIVIVVFSLMWKKKRFAFGVMLDDEGDYSNRSLKLKRIRGNKRRRTSSRGLMGSTDSLDNLDDINRRRQPIPIEQFTNHVRRMHIDGDIGFSEEYELVQPDDKEFTWQHSLLPLNKHKNRYANIVAYDHSRVLLTPMEGVPASDYINANYIDGFNRSGGYIACQGPLPETFDDFWRMLWEQGTATIVMLTQLEERGRRKCDQYWPDRGTQTYGVIRVTASESSHMSYYILRTFILSHKQEEEEPRQVKHYHFTSWPDHGVPTHPVPLLSLVRTVSNANPATAGPTLVHCSAGVGRTGTYITLDSTLQRIEKEQTIDVFDFVQQMRMKRNLMVQTESQYVFIHDALVEAVSCGVTEFEAKKFGSRLRELREVDPETGRTYMEKEFLRLLKDERHHSTFKAANMGVNSAKNRYLNILPYEPTRVVLKMRPGEVGSDYINASYIDGYCRRDVYIATQAPLPGTFEDYWRMIWEQGSCVVVMLTREEEAGKVKCHRYWPSDGTRIFGNVLVELTEEVTYSDYIMRQFNLRHTEEKDSRMVRQYQYTDWPDIGLPESGVGIIDLIGQVEKWQQQSSNSIITAHCSGGVGRTGVYCAISILIERVKAEGVIDVFQTVQSLRLQRPAMVQTLEQYEFCYSTLQEYLDSFDLYANFN